MSSIFREFFLLFSIFLLFFSSLSFLSFAQLNGEACSKLKNLGKFYENPKGRILQSAKLFLSYQHQIGHISGSDKVGKEFNDDFEEFRRFWIGLSGEFGNYWRFKLVSQLSNDRHNYPITKRGSYRQWGHETFRAANLAFDADKFWDIESIDAMEIGYGRRTGRMADEWQRSSTLINCLERSSFSNKLWLYDKENGNPLAVWLKWRAGRNTFDTAIFQEPMTITLEDGATAKFTMPPGWEISPKRVPINCTSTGFRFTSRMDQLVKTGWQEEMSGHYHLSIVLVMVLGQFIQPLHSVITETSQPLIEREVSGEPFSCPCIGWQKKTQTGWSILLSKGRSKPRIKTKQSIYTVIRRPR